MSAAAVGREAGASVGASTCIGTTMTVGAAEVTSDRNAKSEIPRIRLSSGGNMESNFDMTMLLDTLDTAQTELTTMEVMPKLPELVDNGTGDGGGAELIILRTLKPIVNTVLSVAQRKLGRC